MSVTSGSRRRPRRGRSVGRWAGLVALAVLLFAAGVAVGQALEDRPPAGEPVTSVGTIQPWTQTTRMDTVEP